MKNDTSRLTLLNIGYAVHHADWNYKHVNSPFARIYLVKEGKAKVNFYDRIHELTPDHLYIIPPFTLHSYECDSYFALYYIHIYENQFSEHRILEDYFFPSEISSSPLLNILVEQLFQINPERELSKYDPKEYDNSDTLMKTVSFHLRNSFNVMLETEGILMQLLSHFFRDASPKFPTMKNRINKTCRRQTSACFKYGPKF